MTYYNPSIEDIRRLSTSQLDKLNKTQLVKVVQTAISSESEPSAVENKLDQILDEFRQFREERESIREELT